MTFNRTGLSATALVATAKLTVLCCLLYLLAAPTLANDLMDICEGKDDTSQSLSKQEQYLARKLHKLEACKEIVRTHESQTEATINHNTLDLERAYFEMGGLYLSLGFRESRAAFPCRFDNQPPTARAKEYFNLSIAAYLQYLYLAERIAQRYDLDFGRYLYVASDYLANAYECLGDYQQALQWTDTMIAHAPEKNRPGLLELRDRLQKRGLARKKP